MKTDKLYRYVELERELGIGFAALQTIIQSLSISIVREGFHTNLIMRKKIRHWLEKKTCMIYRQVTWDI